MKALFSSLTALCILTSTVAAQDEKLIQAQLVSTTISTGIPENIPFRDRPFNVSEGAELVFFFQEENIVAFDKESYFVEGWDKHFRSSIAQSGKSATVTIYNKKFRGIFEELEAEGRVDVQVGSDLVTKKLVLKKDADPVKFPLFTMELVLDEDNKDAFPRQGVTVIGKHKMIKSICILRDGKELTSNGSSSSNDKKTFMFRDIKDGDEIKFEYWSKVKTKTVKIFK